MYEEQSVIRKKMRPLGNVLVWVGLSVGLPSVLYAFTVSPNPNREDPIAARHNSEVCAVCRHYRGLKNVPPQIYDEDMILVSPGHTSASSD